MENKIIEVLDYIGEKIGIAIDWSAENVMPQVMEYINRYRIYAIVKNSIWAVISLAVIIGSYFLIRHIVHANTHSIWVDGYGLSLGAMFMITAAVIAIIVSIITIVCNINAIIDWSFVPEAEFLRVISGYLST